jgi:PEP-CTERM motif
MMFGSTTLALDFFPSEDGDSLASIGSITGTITYTYSTPTSAPEPSTWAMMLLGFAGLGFVGYRASRRTGMAAA